jgi:hypothetical protein
MDLVTWELCGSKWDSGKHPHVQVSTSHEHIFMVLFNTALPPFHLNFSVLNAWDPNHCVDNFTVITPPMLPNFACGVQHTAKSLIVLTSPRFKAILCIEKKCVKFIGIILRYLHEGTSQKYAPKTSKKKNLCKDHGKCKDHKMTVLA